MREEVQESKKFRYKNWNVWIKKDFMGKYRWEAIHRGARQHSGLKLADYQGRRMISLMQATRTIKKYIDLYMQDLQRFEYNYPYLIKRKRKLSVKHRELQEML